MDDLIWVIVCLYYEACFSRLDAGVPERAERELLIVYNRGLTRGLLVLGGILFMPFILLLLAAMICQVAGLTLPWGVEPSGCYMLAFVGMLLAQILLVAVLAVLCTLRLEWEPRGVALALSEMLHISLRGLQNIWRVLACLAWLALLLAFVVDNI